MKRIGIISGKGELPALIAREAMRRGYYVFMIALEPIADVKDGSADEVRRVNIGRLGDIIGALKGAGIRNAIMAGKVSKSLLYNGDIQPDMKALKLILSLKDRKDDTILQAITEELESAGVRLLKTTEFASDLIMPGGVVTRRRPSADESKDIEFGYRIAKEIGRLDIGQTVVVKNRAVMAVEAIEGTDEAISRGGMLAGGGAVVVKVSKPQQDMRYDVPVIGPDTLYAMLQVNAKVLAVEEGSSLVIEREEMVRLADDNGISISGISLLRTDNR